VIYTLCKSGMDIEARTINGETPLYVSAGEELMQTSIHGVMRGRC
jgi:hypothetical protein